VVHAEDGGQELLELLLIAFLVAVVLIAVLTILGPQIDSAVHSLTGR